MNKETLLTHIREGLANQGHVILDVSYAVELGLNYREAHKMVDGDLIEWVGKLNKEGITDIVVSFDSEVSIKITKVKQ